MPNLARQDLVNMRDAVFFEGPEVTRRLSRFWILLLLASIIASAGVVSDSTATVIGAMIVAPLMTPIQGTMLAGVLGDRKNLFRSVGLVVAGTLAAILVGIVVSAIVINPVTAQTNSQVAARVNPGLIDLLAALATGAVGSIALVRRDISDALPGVAIAISLVPPLVVVGLTFEAGEFSQAAGALLLFVTNVAAILGVGTVVMALYGVHRMSPQRDTKESRALNRRNAMVVIATLLLVVAAPLTLSTLEIARDTSREIGARDASETWAKATGWRLATVTTREGKVVVRFEGSLPIPSTDSLRIDLMDNGVDPADVQVELLPLATVDLAQPASG